MVVAANSLQRFSDIFVAIDLVLVAVALIVLILFLARRG